MGAIAMSGNAEIIGRYAVYGEIASGGMATVHFGRLLGPLGFSRPVAIKRLHAQFAREPQVRAMFIDEARLVSRIRHPNVVPTLDVVTTDGQLLLVMEYVHGESLARLARVTRERRERIPLKIALAIMSNVLHGLHAAHEAKTETGVPLDIVHRDVSPQNVLVGTDGVSRVLDFGIARAAVRLEATQEGVIKGKLAYMPPEQLGGLPVTRHADIYSAGVILWEILAGRRLFLRGDEGQSVLIDKLLRGAIEAPSTYNPSIPGALDAITQKALSRDPAQRFATAREMAKLLEGVSELATPTEIGDWVEHTASESLGARSLSLEELERSSAKIRAASVSVLDLDELLEEPCAVADEESQRDSRTPAIAPLKSATYPVHERHPETLVSQQSTPPLRKSAPPAVVVSLSTRARAIAIFKVSLVAIFAVSGARLVGSMFKGGSQIDTPARGGLALAVAAVPSVPNCPVGMVDIPGGRFFMGADDGLPLERPTHNVTLAPYCVDKLEVTTEDYRACSDHGDCKRAGATNEWEGITDQDRKTFDPLCNARESMARGKHPINCVDWEMAATYCKAAGKRLPTEAEWEFAARGPDGRKYPWGDEEPGPTLLNACGKECLAWGKKNGVDVRSMFAADDGWATTAPVGSFPAGASRYGVQDVVGNVWEWVSDYFAPYSKDSQIDPKGAPTGEERVIRGGAWNGGYTTWVRPTFRYKDAASKRSYGIGFRCAKSI